MSLCFHGRVRLSPLCQLGQDIAVQATLGPEYRKKKRTKTWNFFDQAPFILFFDAEGLRNWLILTLALNLYWSLLITLWTPPAKRYKEFIGQMKLISSIHSKKSFMFSNTVPIPDMINWLGAKVAITTRPALTASILPPKRSSGQISRSHAFHSRLLPSHGAPVRHIPLTASNNTRRETAVTLTAAIAHQNKTYSASGFWSDGLALTVFIVRLVPCFVQPEHPRRNIHLIL